MVSFAIRIWIFLIVFDLGLCEASPKLRIANGEIEGYIVENTGGSEIHAFEGLPFAETPQRLQKPEKKKNWDDVLQAKTTPKRCLQRKWDNGPTSMDCLFLSVIAPKKTEEKLPVIVVVHGGAFSTGGVEETSVPYVAKHLASKGVIIVPIQYRTGPLGFCTTGDSVMPGNYGVFDVKMALEWIRDNIAFFGGNPDQITAYGGSAGAALIDALQLNPETSKLFHKMIIWSGAGRDLFNYNIKDSCKRFLEDRGMKGTTSQELRKAIEAEKELENLKTGWHVVKEDAIEKFSLDWSPVWDNDFFKGNIKELRKNATKKPMIIGMADLEGAGFVGKFSYKNETGTWRGNLHNLLKSRIPKEHQAEFVRKWQTEYDHYAIAQIGRLNDETITSRVSFEKAFGEFIMASVVYDEIDYYQKKNGNDASVPIYLYNFKYYNATLTGENAHGAFHGMDQWYGIGSIRSSSNFETSSDDKFIQKLYTNMMVNFAKSSNPNGAGATALPVKWEPLTNEYRNRNYKIDLEPSMTETYYNGRPEKIRDFSRKLGHTQDL